MIYSSFSFPNINPVAVSVGPFKIYWYGIGYVIGILFSWYYGIFLLKINHLWKNNIPPIKNYNLDDSVIWISIGIIVGGRIGEVIFYNPSYYILHPETIIAVWNGGMSFHGGLIGVSIAIILFSLKNKIKIWSFLDIISSGAPIGIAIVRCCNFINSELIGRVTKVYWGVSFPNGGFDQEGNLILRHPSQLYEAFFEGILLFFILFFIIFYLKGFKKPGLISGIFSCFYGCARFFLEFFREPTFGYIFQDWITMGMILSFPMIIIGAIIIAFSMKKESKCK